MLLFFFIVIYLSFEISKSNNKSDSGSKPAFAESAISDFNAKIAKLEDENRKLKLTFQEWIDEAKSDLKSQFADKEALLTSKINSVQAVLESQTNNVKIKLKSEQAQLKSEIFMELRKLNQTITSGKKLFIAHLVLYFQLKFHF